MNKITYIIIFFFISFNSFSQSIVQRSSQSNTVSDSRLMGALNLFVPRYQDTASANLPGAYGLDTSAQVIYTYNDQNFWVRAHSPKRWVSWNTQTILPDGVYDGGDVAYTGTGLQYIVSPAVFVLNNVVYNTPQTTLTLDPADPTFGRIDAVILTSANNGEATFVTGTPSANPQEPSLDPTTQIRRAIVTIGAGATTPTDVTQYIVYDENLGTPSEYAVTSDGTIDADNTEIPYHLTKAIKITSLSTAQAIRMVYNDTLHTGDYGNLVGFVRLESIMPFAISYNVRLYFENLPVSPVVNIPLNNQIANQYQIFVILSGAFGLSNIDFDEIRITRAGAGTLPVTYMDYIQWQENVVPPVIQNRFGLEDNFATSPRAFNFNNSDFRFNNINKFISTVSQNSDSSFVVKNTNGVDLLKINGSNGISQIYQLSVGVPGAYTMTVDPAAVRIGSGYFLQKSGTAYEEGYQVPIRLRRSYPMSGTRIGVQLQNDNFDAAPNDSSIYNMVQGDWTSEDNTTRTKWYVRGDGAQWVASVPHTSTADSFMVWKDGFYQAMTLSELQALVGSGSVTSVATNAATGITGGTITSTGTISADTLILATRAYAQSISGGGGFTGVTSFSATDGNGFDFTVTNPTTTPVLTATTTVSNTQLMFSNSGAITGSSSLLWDNVNNRLRIGTSSSTGATLALNPSTTAQASLNLGNAGTAPTSPNNGDVWVASNQIFARLNGSTVQISNQSTAGVSSITGTANQVIASASTGAVTLSLPQSIATTSVVQFGRLTLGGTAATSPLTFTSNTDATGAAGRWYYNGTRLAFSPSTTIKRVALTNDAAPANGQIPIGNGTDFTVAAISASNNTLVVTNGSGTITLGLNIAPQTLTSGASITWNATNGFNAILTLSNTGATLNLTNAVAGATYVIRITQGTGGSRTITTWPTGTKWPSGTAPVLSTAVGAIDVISFFYDGTSFYGAYDKNYL